MDQPTNPIDAPPMFIWFIRLRREFPGLVGQNEAVITAVNEEHACRELARVISMTPDEDGAPQKIDYSDIESMIKIAPEVATELIRKWHSGASTS